MHVSSFAEAAFQVVVFGLLAGSIYSLLGLGLTLIMGVGKILNISHGDLGILGAYAAYAAFVGWGVDPLLMLVVVIPLLGLLGGGIQRFVISPAITDPKFRTTASVMITYGLALVIANGLTVTASPSYRFLSLSYAYSGVEVLGTTINVPRLLVLVTAFVVMALLVALLRTRLGKAILASAQDQTLAMLVGVNNRRVAALTFAISSGLAAVAGVLYILNNPLYPAVGLGLTIKGLTVMVLGGIGNVPGAMVAGLILGLAESFTSFYIGDLYRDVIAYLVLIVVLLVRPSGIFRSLEG